MSRKKPAKAGQLSMEDSLENNEGWWRCKGVFTRNYIQQHLIKSSHMIPAQQCQDIYQSIKARWTENFFGLIERSEAYTRTQFLDPTFGDLGWSFIPEASLANLGTQKRPDYCLFVDSSVQQRVAAQYGTDIYRAASTAVEAKKAKHPLDQVSKSETPGWFPSRQIQDYLQHAKDDTRRFFNWAILTNGNRWRLYCNDSKMDDYFEFELARDMNFCPFAEFRLFVTLFGPAALEQNADGKCLLDSLREQSLTQQEELENNLRKRVFNVLEELAEGYYNNPDNGITPAELPAVYDASLIFLYRLLFVLYAESRELLPAKPFGPGRNKYYRDNYSLARLTGKLRDRNQYDDDAFYDLYDDLLSLFHLINGASERQNKAAGVTRYNGGLFDPKKHTEIEKWRVGDKSLADVLRQLVFAQPPARAGSRQQTIATDETVDFGTLEVRQLGDIYEGLLGGHLEAIGDRHLSLLNDKGENHQKGVFYTPDWVVTYLVREALQPLIDEIETSDDVRRALAAQSDERKQTDSFALGVLGLKLVDPAMGSGHFLVRATEWLAEQIVYHPTTRIKTEQIVTTGASKRTREEIVKSHRHPVPPGVPQEEAEIAYWRRRIVESCIYGVDTNHLAVELAKLSLWLTCIAVEEPLSFLDHHLRQGNSLIGVHPDEISRLPFAKTEAEQNITVDIGDALAETLREAIETNVSIQSEASTEMEIVKRKEDCWKAVSAHLRKFTDVLDLWLTAMGELQVDDRAFTAYDYRDVVTYMIGIESEDAALGKRAKRLLKALEPHLDAMREAVEPFHWWVEFPAVFYDTDGKRKPPSSYGFDAVLGNPPYISTHTSSEATWRSVLERRAGYIEDLYLHFTDRGFELLRDGGTFGFIVSDTFFTLASKQRMRDQLQHYRLTNLGQCDPFNATVDAAIFVAQKTIGTPEDRLLFVQARNKTKESKPERELPELPPISQIPFSSNDPASGVRHWEQGCLRVHDAPASLYKDALKHAFFEPSRPVLELYRRFNEPMKALVDEWWSRIENSQKYSDNADAIRQYQSSLKPGDVTLVGLIAEGGQGMRTADNGRFLGYLAGTPQAKMVEQKREVWTRAWLASPEIGPVFRRLLAENGGDPAHPTADGAAWEACVEPLKSQFKGKLGFGRTDLYRIVSPELVATDADFQYAWACRKKQLLDRWRTQPALSPFWSASTMDTDVEQRKRLRTEADISDADFCLLGQELTAWADAEKHGGKSLRDALGLRSSEMYVDPADAPRIATIFNGLSGRGQWVPFRKGDPQGNRWDDDEPLYVNWSSLSVAWLSTAPAARWQGHRFFFTSGVTWTAVANHVAMKARYQQACVFDADSMRLTPKPDVLDPLAFLAILNSDVASFTKMKFLKHTQKWEIGDLRMLPVIVPSAAQSGILSGLAQYAIQAKRLTFSRENPTNELVSYARRLCDDLNTKAPSYLRPSAQTSMLVTAGDCLTIIELAVNWEAEKLYGVEGLGPFDEF